jgi:hypothetical protein
MNAIGAHRFRTEVPEACDDLFCFVEWDGDEGKIFHYLYIAYEF